MSTASTEKPQSGGSKPTVYNNLTYPSVGAACRAAKIPHSSVKYIMNRDNCDFSQAVKNWHKAKAFRDNDISPVLRNESKMHNSEFFGGSRLSVDWMSRSFLAASS